MATFILVHGAWGGGWVYQGVARNLRAAGHDVYVPTLTGLGERSHLASPAIDLATHIQDVVNVIRYEQLNDLILCGHSYGGMVITGVAAAVGERIRTLFYLDAFLPDDGQSLWDIAGAEAQRHHVESQREQPGMVLPMGNGRIDGEPPHMSRHPLLTLMQPVKMTGAERHIRNRTYVYATGEGPTIFTRFYDRVRSDPAWKTCTIATGHMVMSEDPAGLEKLLLEEVER